MPGIVASADGLKDALAGLDAITRKDVATELRGTFNKLVGDVIRAARARASSSILREAMSTLVESSSATGAALRFGAGFPGSFGAEYGAARNQRRVVHHFGYFTGWNQFLPWKGSGADAGYALWPAIRTETIDALPAMGDEIAAIFERARA